MLLFKVYLLGVPYYFHSLLKYFKPLQSKVCIFKLQEALHITPHCKNIFLLENVSKNTKTYVIVK